MTFSEALRLLDPFARHEASLLISHVTGKSATEIALNPSTEFSLEEEHAFIKLTEKRRNHVPLQYLIGTWQFMGLDFIVNEHVLIPRQDTETLAEAAIKLKPARALDLCTGSGCVGISVAKITDAYVTASDISRDALAVAKQNARLNGVRDKLCFVESDLFKNIPNEKYDLIVSNPPYIPSGEIPYLQEEVRDFEPRPALDGGIDGLDFYKRIIPEAKDFLAPGGMLILEAGNAGEVAKLLKVHGYSRISISKDLTGTDRVVGGKNV